MTKSSPHSKRSIKKRLEGEIKKLLPGMSVFVRRKPGDAIAQTDWHESLTYESWQAFIGKRYWSIVQCQREGHIIWSTNANDLVRHIKADIDWFKVIQTL